jgi:hypothetical protein
MMIGKDTVAVLPPFHSLTHFHNLTRDLMTLHKGRLSEAIPLHNITSADAAGLHTDQDFTGPDLWFRHLLESDVTVVIVHGYPHRLSP